MPVVTLLMFAAGGAAIATRAETQSRFAAPPIPVRLAAAIPLVLLAALPYSIYSSQAWLDRAADAFASGDCATATDDARSSISALGSRPEPYELLGYCAIRDGRPRQAIGDMQEAIDRDPDNWNFHYGLALARGAAGLDPRPEALGAPNGSTRSIRWFRPRRGRLRHRPPRSLEAPRRRAGASLLQHLTVAVPEPTRRASRRPALSCWLYPDLATRR